MKTLPMIKIGEREIKHGLPPYIIAEIGVNHEGNVDLEVELITQAKQAGATIILLSANNESKIANLADRTICYTVEEDFQLMKTSYEQFSFLFWDFVAQKIIVSGNLNVEKIEYNHSILE